MAACCVDRIGHSGGYRRVVDFLLGTAPSVLEGELSAEMDASWKRRRASLQGESSALWRAMSARRRKHPVHQPFVERFNEPSIIFLTVCTQNQKRILASAEVVVLLQDSWPQATSWMVGRFIVMPDHLHLFCAPAENFARPLNQWVRYWKTVASRRWPRPEEHPVWQLDFWDTQLRRPAHYDEKWEYVRQNPVRAGLVAEPEAWTHQGELNELRW